MILKFGSWIFGNIFLLFLIKARTILLEQGCTSNCDQLVLLGILVNHSNKIFGFISKYQISNNTDVIKIFFFKSIQFLGGLMATKIGPRISLAMSVLFSSICTLLISFADEFASADYAYVVVLRVLTGLSQSFVYPCALIMVTSWSTRSEKSRMLSFVSAGSSMGIIFATLMSGPMCSTNYWEFNFVVVGKRTQIQTKT